MIYRMMLERPAGNVDSGANYPGCSIANKAACQPMAYNSLDEAINDALAHQETPVRVSSEQEAWDIVAGKAVEPSAILTAQASSLASILPIALGGYLLFRWLKR